MLPATIPIFPLSDVVLFPGVFLPLHIFEPRYRQMVADALAGDRVIGMALLRPGWESDYEGRPAVYQTGCAGVITHAEQLSDGRYNIVLKGLAKFRLLDEDASRQYRLAHVESLSEPIDDRQRQEAVHNEQFAGQQDVGAAHVRASIGGPARRKREVAAEPGGPGVTHFTGAARQ